VVHEAVAIWSGPEKPQPTTSAQTPATTPLPSVERLVRLAAFQNPEFYRAQAMRLPIFGRESR
jgi:hypothetical protein